MPRALPLLRFRCTGCGNCCRDPLLPLTDADLRRVVEHTGLPANEVIKWVDRHEIDLPGEPESFVTLRQGRRVMVLRHVHGHCRFLGADDRCTIYEARPLGCRIFPFDPDFNRKGEMVRLRMIDATDCPYETDGKNSKIQIRTLHRASEAERSAYEAKVADWNRLQRSRTRGGRSAATASEYLAYLGV